MTHTASPSMHSTTTADYPLWSLCVLIKVLILLAAGTQYGYLADELYFLDAAASPALGYVDFPPAVAWILWVHTSLFGHGLFGLRTLACITGIIVTLIAVDVARLSGGGHTARWLTAIVVLFAPAFLSVQSILTMNVFDQLWWVLGFWLLLRYLDTREPGYMLLLGAVFGLALLTKLSLPFWLIALTISAAIHARWLFMRREVWLGAAITLLLWSPFLYWQWREHWPFIEFVQAYNAKPPEAMVIDQPLFGLITTMNPPFLLIWLPGLLYGLICREPQIRLIGTAAVLCLALFLLAGVKFYFATPLFVVFTALGARLWEHWLTDRRIVRAAFIGSMALSGAVSIPIAAPVLSPPVLQQVADFIRDGEQGFPGAGPAPIGRYFPHFAEMHGWPELTQTVIDHYQAIPEGERKGVTVAAAYFGQAGALNQLDREDRLPVAVSGHVNYHLWSAETDFSDVLFVGFTPAELAGLYFEVEVLGRFFCERCMSRENGLYVLRATKPAVDSQSIRRHIKRYYFF